MISAPKTSFGSLPILLQEALADSGVRSLDDWWDGLSDAEKSSVLELWDSCWDKHLCDTPSPPPGMTLRVVAKPDAEDSDTYEGFWHHEFYEYLVNHEAYYFEEKTFHVCTSLPAARRAVQNGLIPAGFQCPHQTESCLMAKAAALAGGLPLRLKMTFVPRS